MQPHPSKLIPYSGVAGIVILWTGTLLAMQRAGLSLVDTRPVSYLGVAPESSVLFSLTLLISAALFLVFGHYAKRTFQASKSFWTFLVIGQLGQMIAAITPYGDNSRYRLIHTIAAFTLAFSLPVLIRSFANSQKRSSHYRVYKLLFWTELALFVVGMSIFIFTKGIAPLGEAMPAVGFHIWIASLTYLSLRMGRTSQHQL